MTTVIKQSEINALGLPNFEDAVKTYSIDVLAWRAHMEMVVKTAYIKDETQKYMPYPPPDAPALVKAVLNEETGLPDYGVEDDVSPVPLTREQEDMKAAQMLQAKKNALFAQMQYLESKLVAAIDPPAKRRLVQIKFGEIASKLERVKSFATTKALSEGRVMLPEAVDEFALGELDVEEKAYYDMMLDRRDQAQRVNLWAAQVLSDIEDLTLDTVDSFVIPPVRELDKE